VVNADRLAHGIVGFLVGSVTVAAISIFAKSPAATAWSMVLGTVAAIAAGAVKQYWYDLDELVWPHGAAPGGHDFIVTGLGGVAGTWFAMLGMFLIR
jgi:hypothetical protein